MNLQNSRVMTQQEYWNAVGMSKYYSHMYYVKSSPVISDAEFDALVAKIEQTEMAHPEWTLPDSPTQKVGSDLNGNGRRNVVHRTPMLSCQKAQSVDAVDLWLYKTNPKINQWVGRYVMMWKYDGISCSLVYQDGQLIEASTRGDGKVGQDILAHVRQMQNVPQQLKPVGSHFADFAKKNRTLEGRIEVRGEIVCPKANLALMIQRYTDCRTAASSLCNQDVPSSDCALLKFMPWEVLATTWTTYGPEYNIGLDLIGQCGFEPVYYVYSTLENGTSCASMLVEKFGIEKREALEYPTDGVVIRVNHLGDFKALGATQHHPKGSIAYKFGVQKVQTVCRRIEVTVGKTGKRTPVAYFDAVTILGREVSSASLYSEKCASELGIKPGDVIEVGLSNDITPKVYRVMSEHMGTVPAVSNEIEDESISEGLSPVCDSPVCSDDDDEVVLQEEVHVPTGDELEAMVNGILGETKGHAGLEAHANRGTAVMQGEAGTVPMCPDQTSDIKHHTSILAIGGLVLGALVIGLCGITALALGTFLAPVLLGALKA